MVHAGDGLTPPSAAASQTRPTSPGQAAADGAGLEVGRRPPAGRRRVRGRFALFSSQVRRLPQQNRTARKCWWSVDVSGRETGVSPPPGPAACLLSVPDPHLSAREGQAAEPACWTARDSVRLCAPQTYLCRARGADVRTEHCANAGQSKCLFSFMIATARSLKSNNSLFFVLSPKM